MNSGGRLTGSVPLPASTVSRKSAYAVSDAFPSGLRVLVVDDDPTFLTILEKMLRICRYEVTKCNRAEIALRMLREKQNGFDIVISDVHMPGMDGLTLLEHLRLEMDLPVIMTSADGSARVIMKAISHGACDYLIKPVRIEELKNIWQHVVRKKKCDFEGMEQSGSLDDGHRQHKRDENEYSSLANEGNWQSGKRKAEDVGSEDNNDGATLKKPSVVWSVELHQQFIVAVNQLGVGKADPNKILEFINVPGLTTENVASNLQKYRLYLKRLNGVSQRQSGFNESFMSPQDPGFGTMSSLGGLNDQTLAVTGRLPAQTLAAYQAGIGRSTVRPGISMPFDDLRDPFGFDGPELRYGEGQRQQLSNTDKPMNLLHGIPTTIEPEQLANLHQPAQPSGGLNMQTSGHGGQGGSFFMQMAQSQSKGQLLNESMGSQASGIHPSIGQTLPSGRSTVGILPRNGMVESERGLPCNPVTQSSFVVDFSVNNLPDLAGINFPVGNAAGVTPVTSVGGLVRTEIKLDMKGSKGFAPCYDIFNELQQCRTHDYRQKFSLTNQICVIVVILIMIFLVVIKCSGVPWLCALDFSDIVKWCRALKSSDIV